MELFKQDGTLKKRSALIAHYTDYVVENAKIAWGEAMKAEHKALYPKQVSNPLYDATAEEPVAEFIDNAEYVEYDVWMAETIVIQEAKEAVVVDGLVIAEPSVPEIREAVRKFEAPMVTEEMLDEYLKTRYRELRAAAYPAMAEYMDAMVKGDEVAMVEYKEKCMAVKAMYPKA